MKSSGLVDAVADEMVKKLLWTRNRFDRLLHVGTGDAGSDRLRDPSIHTSTFQVGISISYT